MIQHELPPQDQSAMLPETQATATSGLTGSIDGRIPWADETEVTKQVLKANPGLVAAGPAGLFVDGQSLLHPGNQEKKPTPNITLPVGEGRLIVDAAALRKYIIKQRDTNKANRP